MNSKKLVVALVVFSTLIMCFVDGIITPPYLIKSIIKIVLFLVIPMIYFIFNKENHNYLKKLFFPKKKDLLLNRLI